MMFRGQDSGGLGTSNILMVSLRWYPLSSHKKRWWFMKSFCKSQFPHESVNFFFMLVAMKERVTDLCGNRLLQNDLINTLR